MTPHNYRPVYLQIVDDLRRRISGSEFAPGAKLPNELELSASYRVSRPTMRNAMAQLEREGYIIRRKFSGTVVAPDALDRKYRKLDIGFFTRQDLTNPESYIDLWRTAVEPGATLGEGAARGYFLRFFPWITDLDEAGNYDLTEVFFHKGVDGFVVLSPLYLTDVLDRLVEARVPHVALESLCDRPGVNTVMFDDAGTVRKLFARFHALGHRKIGLVAGNLKAEQYRSLARRALEAFRGCLDEYGLACPDHWIQYCGEQEKFNIPPDYIAMSRAMLASPERPTAVIQVVERGIRPFLRVAGELRLNVPEDISLGCLTLHGEYRGAEEISGFRSDFDNEGKRVYTEIHNWLRNPSYRPACHLIDRIYVEGETILTPR